MPRYEFVCEACKEAFTRAVSVDARHEKQSCPHCGKVEGKKVFSVVSAVGLESSSFSESSSGMDAAPPAGYGCANGMCGL
jgi:putative FmdB family regulatory protein